MLEVHPRPPVNSVTERGSLSLEAQENMESPPVSNGLDQQRRSKVDLHDQEGGGGVDVETDGSEVYVP